MSSVLSSFSGPKDIGRSCSSVMTVDLPSLSYMRIGMLSCLLLVPEHINENHRCEACGKGAYFAELPDELPTHATRARGRTDVRGDG